MKRHLLYILSAVALVIVVVWTGCSTDSNSPIAPTNSSLVTEDENTSDKGIHEVANNGRAIEVVPLFRQRVDRGERLTVSVFYAKPDKPGKPPKEDPEEEVCPDPNTNQAFIEWGFLWAESGIAVEYHPLYEPRQVAYDAFDAIDAGFTTWENAVDNDALTDFSFNADGTSPPGRDGANVIGWRRISPRNVLAVTWLWADEQNTTLEVDIFFNIANRWAVNTSIQPGDETCGENYDVQAIATHEIGHLIGLGHVVPDDEIEGDETDATMAPSAAKMELMKQTLTPGDEAGAIEVAPAPEG